MAQGNLLLVVNGNPYYQTLVNYLGENVVMLIVFTIGIFLYSIFIWHFYKKLSKRDLFKLNLEKYEFDHSGWVWFKKLISVVMYLIEYCILFPIYILFWFAIITIFLFVITENIGVENILLISMSLIAATRMASYYKEDLANDISKLVPFALLAILITDPYFFSVQRVLDRIYELPSLFSHILDFVVFVFAAEGLFRFLYLIKISLTSKESLELESVGKRVSRRNETEKIIDEQIK